MRGVTIRRILSAVVIAIIMLIPFPSRQVPALDVWVVNESGHPVKDVAVTRRYGFYTRRSSPPTRRATCGLSQGCRGPRLRTDSTPEHPRPRAPPTPEPAGSRASLPLATG
jgi:hypothetical protein